MRGGRRSRAFHQRHVRRDRVFRYIVEGTHWMVAFLANMYNFGGIALLCSLHTRHLQTED